MAFSGEIITLLYQCVAKPWFRNQNLSVHFLALSGLVNVGHDVAKLNERATATK